MAPARDSDTLDQGKGRVNRGADAPDQTNSSSDAELGLGSVSALLYFSISIYNVHLEYARVRFWVRLSSLCPRARVGAESLSPLVRGVTKLRSLIGPINGQPTKHRVKSCAS